jgi:rhodanese-related sulfurtransferase
MKNQTILLIVFCFSALAACSQKNAKTPAVLNVKEFEEKLKASPDNTLVDVRTREEYEDGHLENSVLIDVNSSDFKEKIKKLDKSKTIFVYCAAGVRSEKAGTILLKEGFKKVYHLNGGIKQWEKEEKPIVKN